MKHLIYQWMAKEENISLLLDEISITAENIKAEIALENLMLILVLMRQKLGKKLLKIS